MSGILTITMNPTIDVSASTPEVVPTRKLRCAGVRYDPGGGGINVARVVKRLGGDCLALFPAGGSSGSFLLNLIRQENLSGLPVEISSETRESFTVLEETSGNEFRFVLPGPPLRNRDWQSCLNYLESLADCPPYVVASGSLPPGVPDNFYMEVARITKSLGTRLVIDTSETALKHALEQGVYLVKPNLQELQELTGRALAQPSEWKSAALEIVNAGKAEIVVVT
ncbi:MAG: 1-phosphofructokinase family hexose kinase, partial [Fimbriimonadaceae bacterium]|nr:1-phosphofructokinase family hexose kinase [Alphaproteobacteria bacterium]